MPLLRKYGWRPDTPDMRDRKYMVPAHIAAASLPTKVDLREHMPPVYDQGDLGSCTGNAIAGDCHYQMVRQGGKVWQPSPLFIYYNERVIEGAVMQDSGAEIRDGMKAINRWGICSEQLWKYEISKFRVKPSRAAYGEAAKHKIFDYARIGQSLLQMKSVLASGDPFIFGFSVYESFEGDEVANTGILPMPKKSENMLGGHAVLAVGYDDTHKWFIIRNSWGVEWGDKGYFYMPYDYIVDDNLADDFWTVRGIPNVK
jgi:C1A family cysteine protease